MVGAAGLLGLSLLLAAARRTARRGNAARRRLRQSRRETAAATQQRDDLINERDTARADNAANLTNGAVAQNSQLGQDHDRGGRLRVLRRRFAPVQLAESPDGPPAPDTHLSRPVTDDVPAIGSAEMRDRAPSPAE